MSLLLSEGHTNARHYPLAVVWSEARIIRERHARRRDIDAATMQLILGSLFSKNAGSELKAHLDKVKDCD